MICKDGEHPRGSIYPIDSDRGIIGWVCVNCGANWEDKDNAL